MRFSEFDFDVITTPVPPAKPPPNTTDPEPTLAPARPPNEPEPAEPRTTDTPP